MTNSTETDNDRTLWCGNLGDKITEELLYELFLQAGPLQSVKIPTDREGRRRNFGFILFKHACSVPYAMKLLAGIRVHGRSLNLQFRPGSVHMTPPRNNQGNEGFTSPSPNERGFNFNGGANFDMKMLPPPMMQPLISPGMHRSWSTPHTSEDRPQDDTAQRFPPGQQREQRDQRERSREGRESREGKEGRDRSHDRGRERSEREDRDHGRHGRHRDRDYSRGRDRDYRGQDRNNDSGEMPRARRGETYHGFTGQMGPPPGLMGNVPSLLGTPPVEREDMRRGTPQNSQPRMHSQRNVPPWQRPY